jgi:hypothetical protein
VLTTLTANNSTHVTGNVTEVGFPAARGECQPNSFGTTVLEAEGLPWTIEFLANRSGFLTGSVTMAASFPDDSQNCTFEARHLGLTFTTGGPMTFSLGSGTMPVVSSSSPEVCTTPAVLKGTFAVTANGEPVEAVLGEEEAERGSLSGMVKGRTTGTPVANSQISVCEEELHVCFSGETEAAGHYSIARIPAGFYTVDATPPAHGGYASAGEENVFIPAEGTATADLALPSTGTVTGEVTNTGDVPVDHASVAVCQQDTGTCYVGETESAGDYTITEIPDGDYTVKATPPAHSGYGPGSTPVVLTANETVTADVRLSEAGSVTGTVVDRNSQPVREAIISVCNEEACYGGETNNSGVYTVEDVPDGQYAATVAASNEYDSTTSNEFIVSGTAASTEDFRVAIPVGPPPGTKLGSRETEIGGVKVPFFYWNEDARLMTKGCTGGSVSATASGVNRTTGDLETTSPVTLTETSFDSGQFAGNLPELRPIHGAITVKIVVTGCTQPSEEEETEFNGYVDPSGTVVDGEHGDVPVPGATVTLLTSATEAGPFTAVPNGSTLMAPSNRRNPDTSDSSGQFGWDTLPGYYEVQAHKSGCGTTTTPAFKVPPPVDDLQLVLHCATLKIETTALAKARREVPYEAQLTAGGEDLPFKWKKTSPLPKGLKLSKAGVLSGTIKKKKVPAGIYDIKVEVKDAARHTATATIPLEVG